MASSRCKEQGVIPVDITLCVWYPRLVRRRECLSALSVVVDAAVVTIKAAVNAEWTRFQIWLYRRMR